MLWAQANVPVPKAGAVNPPPINIPQEWVATLKWLYLSGDPTRTTNDLLGGFLTWLKAMGLVCLLGWLFYWLIVGLKERVVGRGRWYDYLGILAIILTPLFVMLRELEAAKRIPEYAIPHLSLRLPAFVALLCMALYVIWIEVAIGRTIRRFGRRLDMLVLFLIHVAFFAGLAAGVFLQQKGFLTLLLLAAGGGGRVPQLTWRDGLIYGARMSATYMGYIVFARVVAFCLVEFAALRGRRLYAIARLSVAEANRRMWAPWVVISVFLLVLAFTHWFLQPPRPAEMGRLYVGTLTLLCSVLLTVMVTILTPLSLPTDIQQQTIYTVVSKPVRRLELVWGRMIG